MWLLTLPLLPDCQIGVLVGRQFDLNLDSVWERRKPQAITRASLSQLEENRCANEWPFLFVGNVASGKVSSIWLWNSPSISFCVSFVLWHVES